MMGKSLKESLNAQVWQQNLPFLPALPGEQQVALFAYSRRAGQQVQ